MSEGILTWTGISLMFGSFVWLIRHAIKKWKVQAVGERKWEAREKDYSCMTTDEELAAKQSRLSQIVSGTVEPLVHWERFELELYVDSIDLFRV